MSLLIKAAEYQDPGVDKKGMGAALVVPLEGRGGFAFALCQLEVKNEDGNRVIGLLGEHIERLASTFGRDANPQHRFEQFLSALNEQVATQVRDGAWNIAIQKFHALVGIACDHQMYLSGAGDLSSLFLHRTPQQRYQVYNLFRSIQTEQSLPTWEKAFAVVLDGELHPGDVFCVSNLDLPRVVSQDELNTILATLPPASATAKIRQYFPAVSTLKTVVIQATSTDTPMVESAQTLSRVSIEQLNETEALTNTLLDDQTPRPLQSILSTLKSLLASLRGTSERAKPGVAPKTLTKATTKTAARLLFSTGITVVKSLKRGTDTSKRLFETIKRMGGVRAAIHTMLRRGRDHGFHLHRRYKQLPATTKYLVLGALGVLCLFAGSIVFVGKARERDAAEAAYVKQTESVEATLERAAGAVIYHDETQARALYAEALAKTNALPSDTPEHQAAANAFRTQINAALDELRRLTTIVSPTVVADLSALAPDLTGRALASVTGAAYVFASDKRVYRFDAATQAFVLAPTGEASVGNTLATSAEDGETLVLDDRPGINTYSPAASTLSITDLKPAENTRWTDVALYGGRVYVLQPSDNQIVRFSPAGAGYTTGANWIKARSTDLSDAVSLAIDGTVFVLKGSGGIVRFVAGSETGWATPVIDPALTAPTDIWTSPESSYVYILEPATERLVILKKDDASLVAQYRSDSWSGLTDFLVDEPNKTIYLIAGSKLFSLPVTHIK
jgi:hypothetical protein